MLRTAKCRTLLLCIVLSISLDPIQAQVNRLDYIDPTIGNVGALLQPTRPTIQLPNQVMRMFPIRPDYMDDQISSFPLLVVSHRLGEAFSLKPYSKLVTPDSWKQELTYDHDLEITRPWYYSTYLVDEEITVEFVPGKKAGIFRFAFPDKAPQKALLLDHYNKGEKSWQLNNGKEIVAMETYHDDIKIYLYGVLSVKGTAGVIPNNPSEAVQTASGASGKTVISFPATTTGKIELRYAVSYISAAQAKKNYQQELAHTSFEQLKTAGEKAWASVMNQIQVEGGTTAQKRTFYSALYRCYERMVDITEDNQYYSGFDKKVHTTKRPFYVDDWSWDTYLAHHPLRTILNPAQEEDMLQSYVYMYEQSGWMPTFPVLFGDHACMNGFHSSITFLDAHRKGLKNFDLNKAYEGMKKNATEATLIPWRNGPKTELDDVYHQKGFFPALHPGEKETVSLVHPFEKRQAVAVTLGAAYDDWAVGELAKDLGKQPDYQFFHARGNNYKNLWSDKEQLFMPKDAAGNWVNINPKIDGGKGGRDYYDENNGWTYLWQVQHDVEGLKKLLGGTAAFEQKLDQLFREGLGSSRYVFWNTFPDATGLVGQYSMGNEPSFHIPYLYNFTQSPWKTQKRIRFLLDTWFKDNVFGIPGDEDGGGMTAFVVFSSMGFYPVTPGLPLYTIGSPLFTKTTIKLQNGKQFTVVANKASVVNKYIQSAKLDGKVLNTPWFTHAQLMAGGKLELEMGPKPNKSWGVGEE
jgi:predicted alpha-1,2-mannosidase